jgi:hypothetical protein
VSTALRYRIGRAVLPRAGALLRFKRVAAVQWPRSKMPSHWLCESINLRLAFVGVLASHDCHSPRYEIVKPLMLSDKIQEMTHGYDLDGKYVGHQEYKTGPWTIQGRVGDGVTFSRPHSWRTSHIKKSNNHGAMSINGAGRPSLSDDRLRCTPLHMNTGRSVVRNYPSACVVCLVQPAAVIGPWHNLR